MGAKGLGREEGVEWRRQGRDKEGGREEEGKNGEMGAWTVHRPSQYRTEEGKARKG